jgi:hypothetical protein
LALNLESILRAQMRKIVLQHYLPQSDICTATKEALFDHLVGDCERQSGTWSPSDWAAPTHSLTSSARTISRPPMAAPALN